MLSGNAYAWLSGWQYRRPITINNSGSSTLADFQVRITVDTASLISAGKMNSDCSDMRFTDESDNLLPYWIESGCDTSETVVWVKVPSIPTSGTTIYMYYGNSSATDASDGDSVFEFFDDFEGTSLDTSKWTVQGQGTYSISNSSITLTTTSSTYYQIYSKDAFAPPLAVATRMRDKASGLRAGEFGNDSVESKFVDASNVVVIFENENSEVRANAKSNGTWKTETIVSPTLNNPQRMSTYITASEVIFVANGQSQTYSVSMPSLYVGLYNQAARGTGSVTFDWVFVRKYADPEPATSIGAEETQAGASVSVSLTHSPTAQSELALDPEADVTSVTVEYNAVFNKQDVNVEYYRAFDGDTNTAILEGNDDVNYITFSRTYDSIGDYNTCVYVRAVDDSNNEYEDTACDVVHIDQYPQALDFDWAPKISFPTENVRFTGSAQDNGTVTYSWVFGDGGAGSGEMTTHAYDEAGTYTVTMTVTDDVGLSKSVSKSVAVYSVPELNWTPATPHAQEPITFTIVHGPRLQVLGTNWEFTDANVSGETNTTATVRFQHYGAGKAVSATFILTDGTNERNSGVSGTVDVDPITWTITLKDEATDSDFNLSKVDSVAVSLLNGTDEMARDTYTAVSKTYEFNNFPTDISAYVTAGTVSYYRTVHVLNPDYEMNIPIYLADPTQSPLVQLVFVPSSENVTVVIQRSGKYIHGAVPDITGTVVAYLVRDVPYTVGYACEDGEVHLIGTYTPITATTIKLTTLCGTVSPLPSKMFAGINFDAYYDANTNSIVVEYSDDTQKTKSVCVDIAGDENARYHECSSGNVVKFTYILPQEYNKASFYVKLAVQHEEYGSFTLTKWVGIGYNIVVPGLPDWAYPWLVLIPALFIILGATAIKSRLAPIVGVGWVALGQYAGWVSLPLGGALVSFMLFLLAITWRSEG